MKFEVWRKGELIAKDDNLVEMLTLAEEYECAVLDREREAVLVLRWQSLAEVDSWDIKPAREA